MNTKNMFRGLFVGVVVLPVSAYVVSRRVVRFFEPVACEALEISRDVADEVQERFSKASTAAKSSYVKHRTVRAAA